MASAIPSAAGSGTSSAKGDKLSRLRELQLRRNEARKLNHQEVVEEDRRKNLPKNHEAKRKRVEWEEENDKKRKEAIGRGEDYDRVKLLDVGADEAEKYERLKRKKNPDIGFSDYVAATARQYQRLTKQIKPDMTTYEREREKKGDEVFYPTVDTLIGSHKDTKEGVDKMVGDLEKQIDKRSKFSRRRGFDEDADVDYINERNMRFNKKLERFYGTYTTEIKQNLERGTAV